MPIKLDPVDYDPFEVVPEQIQYEPVDHDPFAKIDHWDITRSALKTIDEVQGAGYKAVRAIGNVTGSETLQGIGQRGAERNEAEAIAYDYTPQEITAKYGADAAKLPPSDGITDTAGTAWDIGTLNTELGMLRYQEIEGDTSPETVARIKEIKSRIAEIGHRPEIGNLFEEAVESTASFAPNMVESFKQAQKQGLQGAIMGTALGAATGPASPITAPVGAATGYAAGAMAGGFDMSRKLEAGLAYDEMLSTGMDPGVAKVASIIYGVAAGAVEVAQLRTVLGTIPGGKKLMGGMIKEATANVAERLTKSQIVKNASLKYGKAVGTEVSQELTQELMNITATEVGKVVSNNTYGTEVPAATTKEIADRMGGVLVDSVLGLGLMSMPGSVLSTSIQAKQHLTNKKQNLLDSENEGFNGEDLSAPTPTNIDATTEQAPSQAEPTAPEGSQGPTAEEQQWAADIQAQRDGTYRSPGAPIQALALGAQQQRQREMERQEALEQEALMQEQEALSAPGAHINQGQVDGGYGYQIRTESDQFGDFMYDAEATDLERRMQGPTEVEKGMAEAKASLPQNAIGGRTPEELMAEYEQSQKKPTKGLQKDYEGTIEKDVSTATAIGNREETPIPVQQPKTPGLSNFGKPSLQDEISEQPKHEAPQLADKAMQSHIDKRVEKLGSIEAVDKEYDGKDKVSEYARAKAREVFESTEKTVPPEKGSALGQSGQSDTRKKAINDFVETIVAPDLKRARENGIDVSQEQIDKVKSDQRTRTEEFVDAIEAKDFGAMKDRLHRGNKASLKLFSAITGLSTRTPKETDENIRALDPVKYDEWVKSKKQKFDKAVTDKKAADEEKAYKAMLEAKTNYDSNGKPITFEQHIKSLIDDGYTDIEVTEGKFPTTTLIKYENGGKGRVLKSQVFRKKIEQEYVQKMQDQHSESRMAEIIAEEEKDMQENPDKYITPEQEEQLFGKQPKADPISEFIQKAQKELPEGLTIVKDAARWKGAAIKAEQAIPPNDLKSRLKHSKMTTKGDLDPYLMKKYGLNESEARDVSNELTRQNIPNDMTADLQDFKDEPWAPTVPTTIATTPITLTQGNEEKFDPLAILTNPNKETQQEEDIPEQKESQTTREINSAIKTFQEEITDWSGREYKKNSKKVSVGGTNDDLNSGITSVDSANERRRQRNIQDREQSIVELEKAKERIAQGEDETKVLGELLDSRYVPLSTFAQKKLDSLKPPTTPTQGKSETPVKSAKKGIQGKKGTTYLNDNTPIDFQYEVVELDDIITSHNLSMDINPNYPAELQPRDRSRKASIVQVEHMSKNLNPERLGENSSASDGAPIIGNDSNVVESGNGRILALNRAYQGKKGAEYRRWLEKNSGITGVDDFKIKNMKAPILVRRRTTQIDNLANYTQKANERQTAQLSSTEQAVVDAKNLTIEDISIFSPGEDGNINTSNNQTFIKRFLGKMSPEERAGYTTEDGRSNRQLVDRIQSAIFQKAYNSDALLKMTAEEADPDIKNILNGLNASAGVFAKARGLDESLAGMAIINDVVAGINLLRQAKSEYPEIKSGNGKSRIQNQLKQALAQGDIFGKTNKPEVEQVALVLAENIRSGKRIGEFIGNIGTMLKEYITDLPQMDLFGNKQEVTSTDLIERSKKWLEEKYEDKQRDLFEVSQETDPGGKQSGDPNDSKKGDGAGEQSGHSWRTTDEVGGSEGEVSENFNGGLFDEKPKMPKQLDLFSAIPEPGRARQAGKKTKDSGSGPTNKRDVSNGLHHTVRVGVETTGNLEYHGLTAKSPGDIAALLSRLIKSPQEKLYTVSVDKQGVLIEVHAYAKGQRGSSSISPGEIAGRIFTHKNVHKAYYVHNHPSGATDPSPEDHESFTRLSNLLSLRKIKAEAIILGLSENSHESYRQFEKNLGIFGDEKHIPQTINQTSIPIKERVFLEQTPGKAFINSPRILESQLKKRPSGFLLVNSKNREVGYLELPVGIPKREMAALLLDASDKTNARSVFMYSKEGDINGRLKFFKDLGGAIALGDLNAYDMIFGDVNSGHVIHNQSFSSDLDIALSSVNSGESQFSTLPNPKDLYITHNLTEANLIHADKVGGLAVPSLAVSKVDKGGFDNFGEISLIADPSLIDPEKSAQNKVFNTDAYSPRYPEVIYKTDRANMSRLISDIDEVGPEIGKPYFDSDEVSRKGLEALYNDPSLMYRYLKSIGKAPKAKYETKPPIESYFKKFKQSKYSLENNKDFQDAVSRFYKEKLRTKDAKRMSGLKEAWFNSDDGKVKYSLVREMATTVSKANGPKTIDSRAMSNVSRLKVSTKKTKADFRDWVTNNYHDVISGEQILNGFTYSGNKKYLPHDLDTVVKLMKKGLLDGEGFNYGVGSVRAVTSKQFKSIKDIQSDRDKIITSEEMEKIKKEVGDEFDELVSELKPYYKFDQDSFHYYNAASEALKDYAKKGVREFNETYENVPADLMKDVKEYLYKLKNLPTEYFEAKIQRAVGLDEFRYAIVPKGTKAATRQLLKKHGITVKTYDPKVRGDRDRVASGLKNVLFSTDKNQQDKPQVALPQIKKWFKGQSVGINPDGSTWVRIKNGAGLTIRNVKQVAEGKYLLSTESGKMDQNGVIAGKYVNNQIELVEGVATGKTLSHEVEHWLEDIGVITNLDKSVLDIAINTMAKKGEFDKLQDQRENRANFLSQYLADREQFRNRPIGRLLQKIADFLDAMVLLAKATVTGNAQSSVRKVARGIESGQIFSKPTNGVESPNSLYETRVKPAPKETIKAYKLFKVKAKHPGQLFPLFVGANESVPVGIWQDAEVGPMTDKGKVKSKLGPLAFRPGWHAGDTPVATHIGESGDGSSKPQFRPADQVWAEVEVAADVDWQTEANKRAQTTKAGKPIARTAHITDQIPVDGHYRYKTNPNMTGNWIITGAMKINRILSDKEVSEINKNNGIADLPRVNGNKFDAKKYGFETQYSTVPTDQKENEKIVKSLFKQKKTFTESVKDMADKAKSEEERQLAKDKVIANTLDNLHFIKTRLGDRVYKMHRVLTGIKSATFARFLLDGPLSWVGDALQVVDKGKGVIPFLQSIGPDYQNLFLWIAARRAEQLEAEGREFWLTKDKRDAIDAKVGTHAKSGKSWEALNKRFQTINKNVLDIAEQAGLINAEGRAMWESDFYIPFYRIFENEATKAEFLSGPVAANKHISAQIRRLKGSEAQIGDLLENSMTNWMHLIDASARNKAKAAAFEVGVETGIFTELTKKDLVNVLGVHNETRYAVMKPDGKQASSIFDTKEEAEAWAYTLTDKYNKEYTVEPRKNTIIKFGNMKDLGVQSFQKDGKPVYFKTDDVDLYNSMCELDAKQFRSFIMKMFGGSKRLLTKGATFGTMFRINNAIRDTLHTSIVAGSFVPFVDTAIGFTKSWFETKEWREMMSSGFGFGSSYIHSDDPQAGSKYVRKIIAREGRGALSRILHSPGKILEVWEKIGTASENAARVQHYSRLRKKGISVFDAGFEARDLMDFSMRGGGYSIQLLTRTLPFLGARIQGNYKLGRAAKKNPVRFLLKGSMLTMASLALWGAFKDDDRYKELPDWDKFLFMHFWIGDKHFRIPAPFEVGVLFCSLPVTIANIVNGNEDMKFLGEWAKTSAGDVFGIDIKPQLTKPLIELTTNKNTFTGRKIVPDYMEGLPKPEQYHHYTSETAREIGKRLNISPLQVEHLIRGYTSTMGMMALSALDDAFVRDLFDYPSRANGEKKPWGVSRLVSDAKKPATSTKYLTGFYESAKQVADAKRTYNHYLKTAQLDKAADILKEKGLLMALSPATNKIKSRLALINDEMRRVQRSKEYTPSEKEKRLDVLMSERNRAVKAGFEGIRKAKAKQKVAG